MKKTIIATLTAVLAFSTFTMFQSPKNASAKQYTITNSHSYQARPFHNKYEDSAYMWNAKHTKKLHNLKNYPNTNWYATKTITLKSGKWKAVYYKVTSGNKKTTGYVWRGYLEKGKHPVYPKPEPIISYYGDVIPASKIDPALNAKVMSLFPGTIQNAVLQRLATQTSAFIDIEQDYGDTFSDYDEGILGEKLHQKALIVGSDDDIPKKETQYLKWLKNHGISKYLKYAHKTYSSFEGWSIGVYAYPKNNKHYGRSMVYLMSPDNTKQLTEDMLTVQYHGR